MRTVGSVYKRGKVWYILFVHRGKRYRESSGSTDRKKPRTDIHGDGPPLLLALARPDPPSRMRLSHPEADGDPLRRAD